MHGNCAAAVAAAAAKSLQSCPTLCDPIDASPQDSTVPGILQARTLEWAAISFSSVWKWKVKVKSLSRVQLLATPWTAAYQAPPSMGFSRQEYWSGLPLPSLGNCAGYYYSSEWNMKISALLDLHFNREMQAINKMICQWQTLRRKISPKKKVRHARKVVLQITICSRVVNVCLMKRRPWSKDPGSEKDDYLGKGHSKKRRSGWKSSPWSAPTKQNSDIGFHLCKIPRTVKFIESEVHW